MTLRWRRLALVCCAIVLSVPGMPGRAMAAGPVRITTSELPPYAMEHRPGQPGALLEMVEELGRRTGLASTIEFVPWRRATFLASSRTRSAVFPLTRSPERETQYRWLAPLYRERFVFISPKGSGFDSIRPERQKSKRIGTLRGSFMIKYLHDQGYPNVVEAATVEETQRFLRRGIVDAVCADREILRAGIGARMDTDYDLSATLRETSTWLGGSLDFSEADVLRFEQSMREMIADGTYARILKKYQLGPSQ
jgi:polar amino acid transport system substrate-binding protein